MAFADKKGIVVASPFKLQAESMLDVRQQVDTITERNELVTIKAATAGLRVYVKETKKSYVYNGTSWDELSVGNASLIVKLNSGTSEGTNMFTYNGTTNKTINITAAGIGAAGKTHNHTKSEITDFPTSLKNPQALKFTGAATASYDGSAAVTVNIPTTSKTTKSLIVTLNGGTTEGTNKFTFNGSAEKTINITPSTIGAAAATHTHDKGQITGLTTGRVLISDTNGHPAVSAVTSTELGYLDGVTSNIQTQLNGKAASNHTHNYAGSSSAGGSANSAVKLATARKINGTSFDGTKDINVLNNYFVSLTDEDLNAYRTYGEYYAAAGNTCANKPSGVDPFYLKIFRNASGYTAQELYNGTWYSRYYNGTTWTSWSEQYSSTNKPSASDIGAAPASHTHTKSQITDFPSSMKNPYSLTFSGAVTGTYDGSKAVTINIPTTGATTKSSLTIQLNGGTTEGTNKFTFNGGTAKTINITPASIGAAAASHGTHVTYGTSAPKANGTASAGSATSVSRSDHVHPLQTTVSGNAGSATKLATARSIRTNLASTTAASFNGTADVTPGITGTLPISHGGTGATTAIAANYNILKDTPEITDGWSDDTAIAFISASPNTTQGALRKYKALNMWNDWLNAKVGGSYALKSHTHNYLPLSGGTVTGNVILQKGSYVHHATGTGGTSGYVNIATIKVSKTYQNIPIAFEIFRRGTTQSTRLYLTFNSVNGTDPTINKLLFDGHGVSDDFAIAKNATSTWYLYIRKTEAYDDIAIAEYHTNFSYMSGVTVTWTNTTASSLPSGATKATKITEASATPGSLTIQFNGANKATFNGSSSTTVNITPSAIGAAAASHGTHVTYGTAAPKANGTASAGSASTVSRSDHVHPLQTTISGNAGSATKLATGRTIDGVSFNGTANITHYGTCSTAAGTAAKVVSCTGFTLATGAVITVKFTVTNTAGSPTLNVNNTGAKAIQYRGSAISAGYLAANRVYTFIYDGTNYQLIGDINTDTNTTYSTGTASTAGLTKLYTATGSATDGTMTQKAITNALSGKASSSHTHNYAGSSSAGGAANSANKVNATQLTNQNLNNYHSGVNFYYAGGGNSCTNKPSGVDNFGMFVFQTAGGWYTQLLYGSDDDVYTRRWVNDSWTAWSKFYTTTNKPTASAIGAAASSHNHAASNITSGTLPVARGGTGITANPSMLTNLGSTTAVGVFQTSPRPGITGTLAVAHGGTGATSASAARTALGAAAASHTHNYAGSSSAGGAANSAVKLNTARKINGTSFDGTKDITLSAMYAEDLSNKDVSLNTYNLSSGSPKVKYYYCPSDGAGDGITGRPNDNQKNAFFLICQSIRFASSSDYITKQTYIHGSTKTTWERYCVNGTWNAWGERYTSQNKPTASEIGAATSSHTHNYAGSSSAGGAANSVKSSLTLQFNGTTKATFNGSAAATVNITPSAIGAAASSHTHKYAGSSSAGGAATSANKVPVPVGTVLFSTSSSTTFFNSCFGGTWEVVGNIDAILGSSSTLTLYMFKKTAA